MSAEAVATGFLVGAALFVLWLMFVAARSIWRFITRDALNVAARTAGRVTAEVQHRSQQARDAFNDGRRR